MSIDKTDLKNIRAQMDAAIAPLLQQAKRAAPIDMTIIEGPLPGTGGVRYAGFPNDPRTGAPVYFCNPKMEGFENLPPDEKMTVMKMCGADQHGNIVAFADNPVRAAQIKDDPDPALRIGKDPGQWYGFIGIVYPCIDDPTAPHGYRQSENAAPNHVAMRFPSTEMGLRKAQEFEA